MARAAGATSSLAGSGLMKLQRRLSVALVTETYPPEINGVAMTLGRLADAMTARGHRIGIVRPRQKQERSGVKNDRLLLTPGIPIPGYPQLRFGLPVTDTLWRHWCTRRPDLVHVATEGPLGVAALQAARRLAIPAISTFHTNFHSYSRHYRIGWLHGRIAAYLRWFHNRTAATLVPTQELADSLTSQGFMNVGVLSRGVDANLFNPARRTTALRHAWGAGDQDLVTIVVSRIAPEKNLALAMRAFAAIRQLHPAARMVCVGDGPLRGPLSSRHPECLFVGAHYGTALAEHFASADLFLFPSLTETYGNVVSEALASGLPVVAYDQAAARHLITDGLNGLRVPPGDEAAFIAASCALADRHRSPGSPAIRRDDVSASVTHLDWERIYVHYEETLQKIVAKHAGSSASNAEVRFALD
jgi:glycosyltransferase involved in cell wall biosynthesis